MLNKDEKDNLRREYQEGFDIRYVLRDGTWRLVLLLVFGLVGLILTIVFTGVVASLLGKIHIGV